jgi:hypothetical protein
MMLLKKINPLGVVFLLALQPNVDVVHVFEFLLKNIVMAAKKVGLKKTALVR